MNLYNSITSGYANMQLYAKSCVQSGCANMFESKPLAVAVICGCVITGFFLGECIGLWVQEKGTQVAADLIKQMPIPHSEATRATIESLNDRIATLQKLKWSAIMCTLTSGTCTGVLAIAGCGSQNGKRVMPLAEE